MRIYIWSLSLQKAQVIVSPLFGICIVQLADGWSFFWSVPTAHRSWCGLCWSGCGCGYGFYYGNEIKGVESWYKTNDVLFIGGLISHSWPFLNLNRAWWKKGYNVFELPSWTRDGQLVCV